MKKFLVAALIAVMMTAADAFACTSGIISGRLTPDGRPLIWKHRDTQNLENRVDYIAKGNDVKYAFIAVFNAKGSSKSAWMGTNEAGFCIINTASNNMKRYSEDDNDHEGRVMYKALATCRNLADFEKLLNSDKPLGVATNFGVIDAEGGAAYYEANSYEWVKMDVNDPKAAPLGYLVYTNFSTTGKVDGGGGYIRYATADQTFKSCAITGGNVTPEWIFDNLSRNYTHPILGIDLIRDNASVAPKGWFYDMDFIPRRSTASSAVIKGVKPGENPLLTTMWVVAGYPPVSVAVPTMVAMGKDQPAAISRISSNDGRCPAGNAAMERRAKVFPIKRGSGPSYVHFAEVWNPEGTGYMQRLHPVEKAIFDSFEAMQAKWYEAGEVSRSEFSDFAASADFGLDIL